MKETLIALLVTLLATAGTSGLSLAQTDKAPAPAAAKAAVPSGTPTTTPTTAPTSAKLSSFTGELLAMDQTAKTVTVKRTGRSKAKELTFAVEDDALSTLATLKPGDRVTLRYSETAGHRTAKTIVKAEPKRVAKTATK